MLGRFPKALMVALLDANAHVGSAVAPGIGAAGKQDENSNGLALRFFTETSRTFAVNTFVAQAAGPTWFGRNQQKGQRNDYICVSRSASSLVKRASIVHEIDLATKEKTDHKAVSVDIVLPVDNDPEVVANKSVKAGGGRSRFDPASLANLAHRDEFKRLVGQMQWRIAECYEKVDSQIAGPMFIDARVDAWTDVVRDAAKKAFRPLKLKRPRKSGSPTHRGQF